MPRHHSDPINDFFNELLDATIQTLIDTVRPEFRKIAKQAVKTAKEQADDKAKSKKQTYTNTTRRTVNPLQLTFYDVLEVSPHASQETIEAAYKSLARRNHPDIGGNSKKMVDINNAYGVLKDAVKRIRYDRSIELP